MEDITTPGRHDEIKPAPVADVRAVPLARLTADADARRMVAEVLANMDVPSRVPVARFSSAI